MGVIRDGARTLREELFSLNLSLYTGGRIWIMEDLWELMRYDILEACVPAYVMADEEERDIIVRGTGELLGLEEPENSIRYMLHYHVNSQYKVLGLLHRIPRCSSFFLLTCQERGMAKDLEDFLCTISLMTKEVTLLGICSETDRFFLNAGLITNRALMDCQRYNLLAAGVKAEETPAVEVDWPTYEDMMKRFRNEKLEIGEYEPMGDPDLDEAGQRIFEAVARQVDGLFQYQIEASQREGFYRPDSMRYLTRALREMIYAGKPMPGKDGYKKPRKQGDQLLTKTEEWLALADEADRVIRMKERENFTLRDAFQAELLDFLLYLAESDGFLARQEAEAINACCGTGLTKSEMRRRIEEENLYSVTYEKKIPFTLNILCQADRQITEQLTAKKPSDFSARCLHLQNEIGQLFIACDGSANEEEKRDLETRMRYLEAYVAEHAGNSPAQ